MSLPVPAAIGGDDRSTAKNLEKRVFMNVKIAAVTMVCASILIPVFSVYADQGAVVSVNGKISASGSGNADPVEKQQSFKVLEPGKFFSFKSLAEVTHYAVSLFVAGSIEFELGEDYSRKVYWNIDSYDYNICQLTVRHVRKGFLDFQGDRARFTLRALRPGYTEVILSREGKKFIVHLMVK